MNQPTRQEFDELKEEVRRLKEQQTEPMKVILEQRPTEGETLLLETLLRQSGQQATDIGVLKQQMLEARADITAIKATQSDHGELLRDLKEDIGIVAKDLASFRVKNEQMILAILERLPEKGE